jgi:DNA-binding beta-propeller fold protein YncE
MRGGVRGRRGSTAACSRGRRGLSRRGAPGVGRTGATAYDPEFKRAYASNGEGTMTVIDGNAPYAVLQTVQTMPRARTMALDPVSHQIFLTAAETAPGTPSAGTRPTLKPGTFTLLTVTQ